MRVRVSAWMASVAWVLAASSCGPPSLFLGRINDAFFEPTGSVWGWTDALSRPPQLAANTPERFVVGAVYAAFDPSRDAASSDGSGLADLRREIEQGDWLAFQWDKADDLVNGAVFKAVTLRTTPDPVFRVGDASATDVTPGFSARVGFRRPPVQRNASFTCAAWQPPFICQPYRAFGSRARIEVTANSANKAVNGQVTLAVRVRIDKLDADPADAVTGDLTGNLTVQVVSERSAEANMDTLGLYPLFNVTR